MRRQGEKKSESTCDGRDNMRWEKKTCERWGTEALEIIDHVEVEDTQNLDEREE